MLILAASSFLPSVSYLLSLAAQTLFLCNKKFVMLKEASSICGRNDHVDQEASYSLATFGYRPPSSQSM